MLPCRGFGSCIQPQRLMARKFSLGFFACFMLDFVFIFFYIVNLYPLYSVQSMTRKNGVQYLRSNKVPSQRVWK
ncbi:hypothetical protein BDV28DRAFT_126048 [Aspergillus coremiiformis]|uniref:Uncharacterized protein n=1 Tax=Aspergillus coremiiformis TaxID=138285 RepID=A0A5N6ZJM0_9EURO|nr:hypothetical protein BDV28DRAFT_126048 [Aspergillus coremiiformis]